MPNLETPDELADHLADLLGIHGLPPDTSESNPPSEHPEDCECRLCFVIGMAERIRRSVANEFVIHGGRLVEN